MATRPERLEVQVGVGEAREGLGDEDRSRAGELLHAGGEMGGLPHRAVVHAEVAPDGAHDDLARVEPDPDLHTEPQAPLLLRGQGADRLGHAEGGVAGAYRVVLVGHRRAEQGHDAVAHDLVDGALIAMDRVHHALEYRVENLARLFGISLGKELHRTLEVGEHHRDLLALAFQGGSAAEDPLGEVGGRVRLGRRVGSRRRRDGGRSLTDSGGAASAAERGARLRWERAGRAHDDQRRAAGRAEAAVAFVISLASGTLHQCVASESRIDGCASHPSLAREEGQQYSALTSVCAAPSQSVHSPAAAPPGVTSGNQHARYAPRMKNGRSSQRP